jgi:hypothetical protein
LPQDQAPESTCRQATLGQSAKALLFGGNTSTAVLGDTWVYRVPTVFASQPQNMETCAASQSSFSVVTLGTGPFTYQWRKGSIPIDPLANPSASTDTLTLTNVGPDDVASYDCIVTNACGSVTSNAATLTICRCLTCAADFNEDGGVDGEDVGTFFAAWESGVCDADVNQDGGVDGDDVSVFFSQWEAGGC